MKYLLINPPFFRFMGLEQDYAPLSLLSVGSFLHEQGHEVFIKNLEITKDLEYKGYDERSDSFNDYLDALNDDGNLVWKEFFDLLLELKPDIVGINVLTVKYKSALKICEMSHNFGCKVIVGGPHLNVYPDSFPDYVTVYTGEFESFGLNERYNLDDLPMTNFDMLLDEYSSEGLAHIISSRGCPFKCRFCASSTIWGRKVTNKSVDRMIDEMTLIYEKFKPEHFTFWDETFTLNKKRILEFCTKYTLPVKWRCDTRADVISDELLVMMKGAGCDQMSLGVESGSQRILDYIGKNEKLEGFISASKLLKKYDFKWKAYCIIGFPEETEDEIFETIKFIKSLEPFRITLSYFTPYLGTSLYDECLENDLIGVDFDPTNFAHQSSYNFFSLTMSRERYDEIKKIVSKEIDDYNKESIKIWK